MNIRGNKNTLDIYEQQFFAIKAHLQNAVSKFRAI